VRCPRCAADISPLREFCPRCGAATDSRPRDGGLRPGGERSPDELRRNRRAVLAVVAAILALTVATGKFHPFGRHVDVFPGGFHIDTHSEHREPVTIGAAEFFEAYHTDSRGADRRFRNREMVVTGEFVRTVPDGYGSIDMRLKTNHPDLPLGIDLDSHSVDAATRLEPGEMVTVSCRRVAGFGDDPWLQDCVIQPPAIAGPPSPPAAPAPTAPASPASGPPAPPAPR
jgi:hypothetical protein